MHSNGWVESTSGVTTDDAHPVGLFPSNDIPRLMAGQTYARANNSGATESEASTGATSQADTPKGDGDMVRLEALVAVAAATTSVDNP